MIGIKLGECAADDMSERDVIRWLNGAYVNGQNARGENLYFA